jgi:hypothetical protein
MAIVYRDITYGSHPNQKVNLYQPDNYDFITEFGIPIRGVILWIHGGGWVFGSKDINKDNYTSYYSLEDQIAFQNNPGFNSVEGFFDDDFCKVVSDRGYFVISANYRLVFNSGTFPIYNGGGGEYPNNVNDIEELYKYMVFPGYAPVSNVFKSTWDLVVRYIKTYGLFIIGGSAGGHLAVIGAFEGADKTGMWPRGIGSVVGPLDLAYDSSNQVSEEGRSLIDNYATSNNYTQRTASPWGRTSIYNPNGKSYSNYAGFSDLTQASKVQNKMRMYFYYNQNDNLVPATTTAEPFKNWVSDRLGSGYVYYNKVNEVDPGPNSFFYKGIYNSGTTYTSVDVVVYNNKMYRARRTVRGIAPTDPPDGVNWGAEGATHNLSSSATSWIIEGATFTFRQGMSFPRNNNKVRPTTQGWTHSTTSGFGDVRGMVYPRQRSYRYKGINTTPSYTV